LQTIRGGKNLSPGLLLFFSRNKVYQVSDLINDSASLSTPDAAIDRYHELFRHNDLMMDLAFQLVKSIHAFCKSIHRRHLA
jgi:hypothetical protein